MSCHFYLIRYCLRAPADVLAARGAIFAQITLPTLAAQTNPDFEVLLLADGTLSADHREWLLSVVPDERFRLCAYPGVARSYNVSGGDIGDWLTELIRQRARRGASILTTRLDSDDALATDFTERVHAEAGSTRAIINFDNGYLWKEGSFHPWSHRCNMFATTVCEPDRFVHALASQHSVLRRTIVASGGQRIHMGGEPAWIHFMHPQNLTSRINRNPGAHRDAWTNPAVEVDYGRFPIDTRCLDVGDSLENASREEGRRRSFLAGRRAPSRLATVARPMQQETKKPAPPLANPLDRLAYRFRTDKCTLKVTGMSPKGYTVHYFRHTEGRRFEPLVLLEIGVGRGGSLKMWQEYFPQASIYGIDVRPQARQLQTDRTTIFIGDQADEAFLTSVVESIGRPLDVVIDDGGHRMEQQMTSLFTLFPHVAPGGFYAIEDLHTSYWSQYGGGRGKPETTVELLKRIAGSLHDSQGKKEVLDGVERVEISPSLAILFRGEKCSDSGEA